MQNFTIAYSRDTQTGTYGNELGSTDEIALRYTFKENFLFGGGSTGSAIGKTGGNKDHVGKLFNRKANRPAVINRKDRIRMRKYQGKYKHLKKGH